MDRCPLTHVAWEWNGLEYEEERLEPHPRPCNAELHLVWHLDIPVDDENVAPISTKDAGEWANTSSWEVVCENGHVLARSSGAGDETADYAEPYVHAIAVPHPCAADGSQTRADA